MTDLQDPITNISLGAILMAILTWLGRLIKPRITQIPEQLEGMRTELTALRTLCESRLTSIENRLIDIERLLAIVDLRVTFVDRTRDDHMKEMTRAIQRIHEERGGTWPNTTQPPQT
jgi:hypothetical protein